MSEPRVLYCTLRDGDGEIHVECRMSDGQKGAFIRVDAEFPGLAQTICDLLNRGAILTSGENINRGKMG